MERASADLDPGERPPAKYCLLRQKAASAYFTSKQIRPFVSAEAETKGGVCLLVKVSKYCILSQQRIEGRDERGSAYIMGRRENQRPVRTGGYWGALGVVREEWVWRDQ